MSLYVLPENQKLIWDTVNKIPEFQHFGKDSPKQKEMWFKNVIQMFYEENKTKTINKQTLPNLNKETLAYMIKQLKEQPPQYIEKPLQYADSYSIGAVYNSPFKSVNSLSSDSERKMASRDYIAEQKQLEINQQFLNRQQEYEIKQPAPQEIDFRETKYDEPIEDMEYLIQQHMKQRELDMRPYDVPPIPITQTDAPMSSLEVIEINEDIEQTNSPKKTVQWSDQNDMPLQIQELKNELIEMKTMMSTIYDELILLKKLFAE